MNKGIIILGSAASGKSHFEEQLYNYLYNKRNRHEFRVNPDYYVEDEESEYYNNPLGAYNYVYKTILPEIIDLNGNFILQNTGANIKTLRKIIDTPNYQFKAVIVYCNPIIAFIRNFSRDRKLPKQVLLENWLKVYSQIDDYMKLFGEDNIYVYETEYTPEEEKLIYENNFFSSVERNIEYFISKSEVTSSFKKENTKYSEEDKIKRHVEFYKLLKEIDKKHSLMYNNIKKLFKDNIKDELNKWINQ